VSEHILDAADTDQKIIYSDGKKRAKWNWLFALAWNGFVFTIMYFQWEELAKIFREDPLFYVFISFPIIGIFLLYKSISDAIDWFKFGEAPLTLNTYPVHIGGNLSGYIDIDAPYERGGKAEVSLRCSHHYIDDSGSDSNSVTDVLWQDDLVMPCQPHGDKIRVLFSFSIDDDLPQSQGKSSDSERHEWNVVVKLPVLGKDLVRVYVVSVDKHYPLAGSDSEQPAANYISNNKLSAQSANQKIPRINNTHAGKSYYYPTSRHRAVGIVLMCLGLFFGGMIFGMIGAFSDFLPVTSLLFALPFILAGGFMFLFGLLAIFHQLEVVVSRSGVGVNHKVLFYSYRAALEPDEIADIKVSRSGSSSNDTTSTVWYQLKIIDSDGLETTVGDSLAGISFAKYIRQEMIDGLDHTWQPREVVQKPGRLEKLKSLKDSPYLRWLQTLTPIIFILAVAYDIWSNVMVD